MFETLSSQLFQSSQQSQIQSMIQSKTQFQSSVIQFMINAENVLNVKTKKSNTKFLRSLKNMKRAFRIKCTIIRSIEKSVKLRKITVQIDQESNMNIMIESLKNQLDLFKNKLTNIKFHELFMKTANHRNTYLKFWIECSIIVKKIMKMMKCLISSSISIAKSSTSKHIVFSWDYHDCSVWMLFWRFVNSKLS
jgi:hypothetical protein